MTHYSPNTPIMTHSFLYQDDCSLAYTDSGSRDGFPVLVQHGMIASVEDAHLFQRLADAGARLIAIARPGYGASSPYPMHNVGEWGEIVALLVDHLGLRRFDVFGISSGAPYAYAIAAHIPEKTRSVFILSGIPALCDDAVLAHWPHPSNRNATVAEMQPVAREVFFSGLPAGALAQPDVRDAMMHDCFGPALDLSIRAMDWGFTLAEVHAPVTMRHSREDLFAAAELTAQMLPHCTLEAREHDPHFSQEVLDDFITSVMARRYV